MSFIPLEEFKKRLEKIQEAMEKDNLDVFLVYGDEYRRENLRYFTDYWPIFELAMLVIGKKGNPVLLVGPEGERYAREASIWPDIRIAREMEMAYVPEKIEYTLAHYAPLPEVLKEMTGGKKLQRVGICGIDAMSVNTYRAIEIASNGADLINTNSSVHSMRLIKSQPEIDALKKAWEICDTGYKAVLDADIVGLTEIQAAALGEKAARDAGAEALVFSVFASGERTNTVIGRATEKIIQRGDIIMFSLAIQYNGYIATNEWPFVAGAEPTASQKRLIDAVIVAEDIGIQHLKPGVVAGEVIQKIRQYFQDNGFAENDLYPPIHGNGLAEAESPYPDEETTYTFKTGMGINFDVSLFGVEGAGSNRIEEGFVIGDEGLITLSPLISGLREEYLKDLE